MNSGLHDQRLWNEIRQGSEQAFSDLYFRYDDQLLSYGYTITRDRNLIKDAIQELFLDIWKRRNATPELEKVKYYLLQAFRRLLLRRLKQDKDRRKAPTFDTLLFESPEEDFLIATESASRQEQYLANKIKNLSKRQQEIIYLKYYQGFSYDEIALIMGIQHQAAWNLLCRAIGKLREQVADMRYVLSLILVGFFNYV